MLKENDQKIRFSVVIPNYNKGGGLLRAVRSFLEQDYNNFEILIVDDGSADNSVDLVTENISDSRVRVIKLGMNNGVHIARNKGIELAIGEYILFLDSDDEVYSSCLSEMEKVVDLYPEIVLLSAPYVTDEGELTGLNFSESGFVSYDDMLSQKYSRRLKPGIPLVRSDVAKRNKFVAPNLDFIFYRYVMREGRIFYIANPLGIYHINNSNDSLHTTRKKFNYKKSVARAVALESFIKDFKSDYLKFCPQTYANIAYGSAVGHLFSGHYYIAISRSFDSVLYSSGRRTRYVAFFFLVLSPIVLLFLILLAYV